MVLKEGNHGWLVGDTMSITNERIVSDIVTPATCVNRRGVVVFDFVSDGVEVNWNAVYPPK